MTLTSRGPRCGGEAPAYRRLRWRAATAALVLLALASAPVAATANPVSRELTIGGLSATLTEPAAPAAAGARRVGAVIISGSGPTDRDGGSPQGLDTGAYRLLAAALAEAGIVSIRYDKRGVARSASAAPAAGESGLTIETFADDAVAVAEALRAESAVARVVLIGHSEGGLIALLAASRAKADGLVLLTTAGRPLSRLLRDQLARQPLPAEVNAEAERVLVALESGQEVGPVAPPLDQLFRASVLPFLRSVIALDPVPLLAARPEPTLIVGAGKDFQVLKADFDALIAARTGLISHWEADATHTLKLAASNDPGQLRSYRDPSVPLAPGIVAAVSKFVLQLER